MSEDDGADRSLARQQRLAGFVIAGTMLGWLLIQGAGAQGMIPVRFTFLADFAALAAMVWALVVTFRVWRKRRDR
ncbi:DUF5337 family protein [Oceaniglobus roseus]|uniref:DUF5337 family protein n=1 Tax=Oceaniglobus roseus TaxID=1737570 RepID=UPI000C7EC907|nr:DUF5337 family protein [Kandeliimicrobium roseum]